MPESPTSDAKHVTVAKRASFCMEFDFGPSTRPMCCHLRKSQSLVRRSSLCVRERARERFRRRRYTRSIQKPLKTPSSSTPCSLSFSPFLFSFSSHQNHFFGGFVLHVILIALSASLSLRISVWQLNRYPLFNFASPSFFRSTSVGALNTSFPSVVIIIPHVPHWPFPPQLRSLLNPS